MKACSLHHSRSRLVYHGPPRRQLQIGVVRAPGGGLLPSPSDFVRPRVACMLCWDELMRFIIIAMSTGVFNEDEIGVVWENISTTINVFFLVQVGLVILALLIDYKLRHMPLVRTIIFQVRQGLHKHGAMLLQRLSILLHGTQLICSMFVTSLWVARVVYRRTLSSPGVRTLEFVVLVFFLIHYILRVREHHGSKFSAVIKAINVVDMLAIISAIYTFQTKVRVSFNFLRMLTVMDSASILLRWTSVRFSISPVSVEIVLLGMQVLVMICVMASFIFVVENLGDPPGIDYNINGDQHEWTMFTTMYFVFVTLTTVGYGDISAKTLIGRGLVIVFVVSGIIVFTSKLSELSQAFEQRSKGLGRFSPFTGERFVIVCGRPNLATLTDLMDVMFHQDLLAGKANPLSRIVLLSMRAGETHFKDGLDAMMLKYPRFEERVTVLNGSPLNPLDLRRAAAHQASAFFVMADNLSENPTEDDTSNILRALSVSDEFPNLSGKIFVTVRKTEFYEILPAMGFPIENCIFSDLVMTSSLALNTSVPGFSTLLYGLCLPYSKDPTKEYPRWLDEYLSGLSQEIYIISLATEHTQDDRVFKELVVDMYTESNKYMVLLAVAYRGHVLISPTRMTFGQIRVVGDLLSVDNPIPSWDDDRRMLACIVADDSFETEAFGERIYELNELKVPKAMSGGPESTPLNSVVTDLSTIIRKVPSTLFEEAGRRPTFNVIQSEDRDALNKLLTQELGDPEVKEGIGSDFKVDEVEVERSFRRVTHNKPASGTQFIGHQRLSQGGHKAIPEKLTNHIVLVCSSAELIANFIHLIRNHEGAMQRFQEVTRLPRNLLHPETVHVSAIVVLYDPKVCDMIDRPGDTDVFLLAGNPRTESSLLEARVHRAKSVVVFNSNRFSASSVRESGLVDVESLFTILKVHDFVAKCQSVGVEIISSIESEDSIRFLKYAVSEFSNEYPLTCNNRLRTSTWMWISISS